MIATTFITNTNQYSEELNNTHWGIIPATLCMTLLAQHLSNISVWLIFWATLMASYDVAVRRIPNPLTAIAAISGIMFSFMHGGVSGGMTSMTAGLSGFGIMAVLFFLNFIGAGDVKAVGALATFLTPMQAFHLTLFTAMAGGVLAIISLVMAKRGSELSLLAASVKNWRAVGVGITLPYALAIWGGCLWLIFYEMM